MVTRMSLGRTVLAIALLGAGVARATDLPHNGAKLGSNTCEACHLPHGATGPALTQNSTNVGLCFNCHGTQTGTSVANWTTGDQAVVGTSGTSHRWDAVSTNSSYGATTPTTSDLASRLSGGKLQCSTCHDQHSQLDAPTDPDAPAYAGSTTIETRRHFQRIANDQNQMCVDCHARWNETTVSSRSYAGAGSANFNSHPVLSKDSATSLSLPNAGSGNDFTYRQIPLDAPVRFKATSGTTTTVTVDTTKYTLAAGLAPSFILKFTSGKNANVPANISAVNVATGTITLQAPLGAAPAAGDAFEIDRVADTTGWEIADATGTTTQIAMSSAKAWPTTGLNVPNGATVTILATPAASKADVGKTRTITGQTATTLSLNSALSFAVAPSTVFRINWPEGNNGAATTATAVNGTTLTDSTKGWPVNGLVGLSVLVTSGASKGKLGVVSANSATAVTFAPALAAGVAVGDTYEIRPYQVGPYAGFAAAGGTTTTLTASGSPGWTAGALKNLIVRFTRGVAAGQVSVISANTANTLTFSSVATAPSTGDAFQIDVDGNTSNNMRLAAMGSARPSYTTGTVACTSCHGLHYADSDSGTFADKPRTGDGRLLRRAFTLAGAAGANGNEDTCDGCHNTQMHNSIVTGSTYGAWGAKFTCGTCHQPHQTNNIYLIRPSINAPNGSTYSVALQNTAGMAAGSFATASLGGTGPTYGPCEVCHTQTSHYRNGGTAPTSHYTGTCTACHSHASGFKAGESNGGTTCEGCHNGIWSALSGGVAKTTRHNIGNVIATNASVTDSGLTWYNSYAAGTVNVGLGATTVTGGSTTWDSTMVGGNIFIAGGTRPYVIQTVASATSLTIAPSFGAYGEAAASGAAYTILKPLAIAANVAANRSCVNMCHDDHVHNLTSPAVSTHENNVYLDARSSTSRAATSRTSADKDNTDFDRTAANGGMCLSCHSSPVDATHPAVATTAQFSSSAHSYTSNTVAPTTYNWQYVLHDGGVFQRNCTKCHSDRGDARPSDSSVPFGAVHYSDYPSLLAGDTHAALSNGVFNTTQAGVFVCYNCHGGALPAGAGGITLGANMSGKNIAADIANVRVSGGSGHPADNDAVHSSVTEFGNAAFGNTLGVTGRHAGCIDCHDPHEAQKGTHAIGNNLAGGALQGAWGAKLSSAPSFWTAPTAGSFTKTVITAGTDLGATLCFKCHTAFYGTLPTAPSSVGLPSPIAAGGYTETDQAMEFNPNNAGNWKTAGTANQYDSGETAGSFHPVLADCSNNLGATLLGNLVTTNFAWSTTVRNKMTCADCHGSDQQTDPVGPHGSAAKFVLRGPNTLWNSSIDNASTAGIFCANCHTLTNLTTSNSRYSQHQPHTSGGKAACFTCHVAIPHGSMRPGLLSAGNGGCSTAGSCGTGSQNINVGGTVVSCANGNGAGVNCLATDNPPYNQAPSTYNKLRLAYYPSTQTANWDNTSYCGCGNVNGGTGH